MTALDEHTCPTCGTPVTVTTRNPNRRYCSPRCKALGWRRRANGLPENGERTPTNAVANPVANGTDGVAKGANPVNAVANGDSTRAVQTCPHCRQPISLITLIVPPAAAFVTVPDPPTTSTRQPATTPPPSSGARPWTSDDAIELGELLTFLGDWLGGTDNPTLAASLRRFVGTDGYDITELRADMTRFAFLLGADDGTELFGLDPHP
jgi:endogenous inhibitor of DNA gyrase (YacG/DUF329 family)